MSNLSSGAQVAGPPKALASLQALVRLRPPSAHSRWGVLAYALNRDLSSQDDTYGMVFHMGSFGNKDEADQHAKNIIALTGHKVIVVSQYGAGVELTTSLDTTAENTVSVKVDSQGRLLELEKQEHDAEIAAYEKTKKFEEELLLEAQEETDPDHIEHFKRKAYLAVRNHLKHQSLQKQADEALAQYEIRCQEVRDHFACHPEHEMDWLPYFEEKLTARNEADLYNMIATHYQAIRDEILQLSDNECEDGICLRSSVEIDKSDTEPTLEKIVTTSPPTTVTEPVVTTVVTTTVAEPVVTTVPPTTVAEPVVTTEPQPVTTAPVVTTETQPVTTAPVVTTETQPVTTAPVVNTVPSTSEPVVTTETQAIPSQTVPVVTTAPEPVATTETQAIPSQTVTTVPPTTVVAASVSHPPLNIIMPPPVVRTSGIIPSPTTGN